ncbi:hypothetical protein [Yoonia maricola]|uniref:hypothetical protein n=1 Tax=Yoonia maricola TaxID=420999 RepID=UPI001454F0D9|nr:hypothetical protein [Yoonia maricola]
MSAFVFVGLSTAVMAQDSTAETSITDTFAECRNWVETGDPVLSSHWQAILLDEPFQDRHVSIFVSNTVPLYLLLDKSATQSDVSKRSCAIRLADTSRPVFEWVNGAISTAAYWDELIPLPPDLVAQQLRDLRLELSADPDFARVGDPNKENAMFAFCNDQNAITFTVYPDWRLAGFGGWEVRGFYDAVPATADSQAQRACDAR